MIKIGYVVSSLENSGPVNIMFNILKYINYQIFSINIYTLSEEKKNSRIDEFSRLGCKIKKIDIDNKKILFGNIRKVEKIFLEDSIDVLHAHCFRSTLLISKIKKIKKIVTIHAEIHNDYKFQFGFFKGKMMELLFFNSLKFIDSCICCSESVKKSLIEKTKVPLSYIQNGVDLSLYEVKEKKEKLREKLQLENEKKIFIVVGSLCSRKNPLYIVHQFLKLNNSESVLVLLGEGVQKEKILKIKNEKIKVLGKVGNVKEYLAASDYYISASNSEGLPNSVLEALALKRPVILSDIASHHEILAEDGKAGFIFKRNKIDNLLEKMIKIQEEDYKYISESAYSIVKNKLNAEIMSERYSKVYKELVNKID